MNFFFPLKFLKRNSIASFEKLEFKTDPTLVSMNASLQNGTITAYAEFFSDIPPPINFQLNLKHFSNGAYIKSFMNVEIDLCAFLKSTDQNPLFKKIFEFVRSFGKIFDRCPLKQVMISANKLLLFNKCNGYFYRTCIM
jgi:Protein of unknown function (DUF1091)